MMRFRAATVILPAFLLLFASSALADYASTLTYFNSGLPDYQNATVQNLTLSNEPMYTGTSADFALTLYNNGSVEANATGQVLIYNATDGLVDSFNFTWALVPPFSTMTLLKTWNADSLPAGVYCANASAFYNNDANVSPVFSHCFSLINPPVGPGGGSTGGPSGGGNYGGGGFSGNQTLPKPVPPGLVPQEGDIKFLKFTVVREVVAGTSTLDSFTLRNDGGKDLDASLVVSGAAPSWIAYAPQDTTLRAGEERVINFPISVPDYALPGDYLIKLEVRSEHPTTEYMVLRVKSVPSDYPFPVVLRQIKIDRIARETTVSLTVRNPSAKAMPAVGVQEAIPKEFNVKPSDVRFLDKPAQMRAGIPISFSWDLALEGNEITFVSYSLPVVLKNYDAYVSWYLQQITVAPKNTRQLELVQIRNLFAPELFEGEESEVQVDVFYAGHDLLDVKASLEPPADFDLNPEEIARSLVPEGVTRFRYKVRPPANSAGTHLLNFRLVTDQGLLGFSAPVQVKKHDLQTLGTLLARFQPATAAILAVALVAAAAMYISFRKRVEKERARRHYKEDRSNYLDQLKHLLNK